MPSAPTVRAWAPPVSIAALRAKQWVHFIVLPLAALDATDVTADASVATRIAIGVTLAALALAYAYGLNAISDRATDLDRRKNPLAGGACPSSVVAIVVSTAVLALALAATTANQTTLLAVAVSLASSTSYSVGPRLKLLPAAGTLLNAGIFAPLVFFAVGDHRSTALSTLATAFVALLLQNQLLHERADAVEDADAHAMTTARALGPRTTSAIIALLGIAGAAAGIHQSPTRLLAMACVVVCVLATASAWIGGGAWARRRVVHRWTSFALGALLFAVSLWR